MPKIISAYAPDDSLASSLSGLANSFMGGNGAQTELYRQKALEARNQNANLPLAAEALARGDVAAAIKHGVLGGMTAGNAAGYNRLGATSRAPDINDPSITRAMLGAGDSYASTPQGTEAGFANARTINDMTTKRVQESERYKTDTTPETVLTANGPQIVRRSEAFGQAPVLSHGQATGMVVQQDMPNYTPDQRLRIAGADVKNPASIYTYQKPDGTMGNTVDGRTDVQTGQPVTGAVMKLEGPNTDGLSGDHAAKRQLMGARISRDQSVQAIDRLDAALAQPNADQSVGMLGHVGGLFNGLRAQTEAGVRLFGGELKDQAFATPENVAAVDGAMNYIFGDPNIVAKAKQLGIDNAVIRSQIQDLAYMYAKTQDPGGRVSTDDIRRAQEAVGGMMQDPKAGRAVLADLRQRVIGAHTIVERNFNQMYPGSGASAQPAAAAPVVPDASGAQPAAPARPAATAAPAIDPNAAREELRRRGIIQ